MNKVIIAILIVLGVIGSVVYYNASFHRPGAVNDATLNSNTASPANSAPAPLSNLPNNTPISQPVTNTGGKGGANPPTEFLGTITGNWGGEHATLSVDQDRVTLEFDCGHGSISPVPVVDNQGNFAQGGTYSFDHGGPVQDPETPSSTPAVYAGHIVKNEMTLTITLTGNKQKIGPYYLFKDAEGKVFRCL